jgi:hypothetical protein
MVAHGNIPNTIVEFRSPWLWVCSYFITTINMNGEIVFPIVITTNRHEQFSLPIFFDLHMGPLGDRWVTFPVLAVSGLGIVFWQTCTPCIILNRASAVIPSLAGPPLH